MPEQITSAQNPRVKNLVRLRDGSHRRRQKVFLVEGFREIRRAVACGWPLETVFFCEELFMHPDTFDLLHEIEESGIELVQMAEGPFAKAAFRQGPDGLLAVARQRNRQLEDLGLSANPLLVILEGIEKPGNLGAIFRTANAAGADAIILTEAVTDPYNPNTVRASQGAFFQVPFCSTDNTSLMLFLEERQINVVPTSPGAENLLWDAPLQGPSAIVFGTEDEGLSKDWLTGYAPYKLPMAGVTDSLNVASTTAIALFEAVRQRRQLDS